MSFRVLSALTAMLFLIVSVPVLVQREAERTTTENFGASPTRRSSWPISLAVASPPPCLARSQQWSRQGS